MSAQEVVIIGGGPGGLLTAYLLRRSADTPMHLTLIEASHRLGGKLLTQRFPATDSRYEAGAAELYDYSPVDDDPLRELIESLGIATYPMEGPAVLFEERLVSNTDDLRRFYGLAAEADALAFDAFAKSAVTPREFYDAGDWDTLPTQTEPDFDRCLDRIRDPRIRRYIETMIHSDLAAEPSQTSTTYGLHNYVMNDGQYMRLYGLVGGMEMLPQELATRIDARIHLNHEAISVDRSLDQRWEIQTRTHNETRRFVADHLVLALPIEPLKRLQWQDSNLAESLRSHLQHHDHPAHYLRVTLCFETPYWRQQLSDSFFMLDRFGGCCLYDESSRRFDERHGILGLLLGGDDAREMAAWTDDRIIRSVLDALPAILREGQTRLCDTAIHRWTSAVSARPGGPIPRSLDQKHRPARATHPTLYVVGDYLFDTTINGVLDSATYVAESLACCLNETTSSI